VRTITNQAPIGDWEDPEIFDKRCPALEYWLLHEKAADVDSGSDLVGIDDEPDELTGLTIRKPHIVLGSIF
jgi:hypothetical protein